MTRPAAITRMYGSRFMISTLLCVSWLPPPPVMFIVASGIRSPWYYPSLGATADTFSEIDLTRGLCAALKWVVKGPLRALRPSKPRDRLGTTATERSSWDGLPCRAWTCSGAAQRPKAHVAIGPSQTTLVFELPRVPSSSRFLPATLGGEGRGGEGGPILYALIISPSLSPSLVFG
ncbi:hypothetical protein GGS23DRAFT_94041 [Durotheca rogersii]|uniref:uncharacterized protein n=1 Tax=Durotheca rogersii TaxID=419775 RepID=UPI00221EE387|nr:uncharacterized protein GGS23DRAFT_94041 [Durotheca rogersii]KAI5862337.1 hypothetical protein GGS23DRAFT_94041 [Durotheca rogersii]